MRAVAMVSIECTCIAFLLVILTAYIVLPRFGSLKRDAFFYSSVTTILGLTADMLAWACECVPSPAWLQYSCNTLCLVVSGFILSSFSFYVVGLIREKKAVSWSVALVVSAVNICGAVAVIICAACGKLYRIFPDPDIPGVMIYESGGFVYGLPNLLSCISLTVLFAVVLCNAGVLGKNRITVFSIYFLLPLAAGILELLFEPLQFSYASTGISMSIVYVMLQSSHMDELLLRQKLLNEWSYLDPLTRLLNRRAFDRDVESIAGDGTVSIAFCDLNGLKKVNDEKGHQAGDEYLTGFSEMLTKYFPHDCVYRISGDEFVVVDVKTGAEEFDRRIAELKREIAERASIAAVGTARGYGASVSGLLKEAETGMYCDKELFYKTHPGLNRRRSDR